MNFNTSLLHGKAVKFYEHGATLPSIVQSNAFRYSSAEELDKVFSHKAMGYAYSRVANPTVAAFEQRINELEHGNAAVGCSSGMAAILLSLMNILCTGDEIIASSGLYGGSIDLFEDLKKFGITARFVDSMTVDRIEPLINEHTRVVFGEVISNPSLKIMDVEEVSKLAHAYGIPLLVDATTATPYLINPIDHGADVVIHSTTKYINGSGDSIGGIIIDGAHFPWDFEKFEALSSYSKFGKVAYTVRLRTDIAENLGGYMSPMTAFLNVIGLETLGLRMNKICCNAARLATALSKLPGIEVNYPLNNEDNIRIARKQMRGMGGGILTFRAGSKEKAFNIINDLKYVVKATSIGDVRTLVIHPDSTLYVKNTPSQKEAAGVYEDTIRVSVGIEDVEDLIEDFTDAVNKNI
ncbi:MAG: O-acetylhomoserine aminocarboxypropyltransferase/cysteine synthase [Clostridiales bacterium]|nr:O-acetylhomoserine aminocarboxypropyltransferase/cysteine synthase [Clostridiales bacterium]